MKTQFFKTVLAGILAAAALFMLPFFLLRVFIFFLLIGTIFKLLGGKRHRRFGHMHPAFANRFKSMSEEDQAAFKQQYGHHCYYSTEEETVENTTTK